MMLCVHSFPGGNEACERHYPLWAKGGYTRIVGIGTLGGGCRFPAGMESTLIGQNSYINGEVLPLRLLKTIEWMLWQPDWGYAAIIEYDTILLKPLPLPVEDGLHAVICGGKPWGLKCNYFMHNPWLANRETWQKILTGGMELLKESEVVGGSPDCFLGWLIERYGIPLHQSFGLYSQNTICSDEHINSARQAIKEKSVCAVHGIKTKNVLDRILAP